MDYENKNQPITDSIDHELIDYWKKLTHKPTVIVCNFFCYFINLNYAFCVLNNMLFL